MKFARNLLLVTTILVVVPTYQTATAKESKGTISKWGAAQTFKGEGWEFKIGGRVQLDYSKGSWDQLSGLDFSKSEARRVRLGVKGKHGQHFEYKVELNSDGTGDVNVEDAYLKFNMPQSKWAVRLGQFKTANSLDEQTSSRFISALERSAFTDAFGFNRRVGVDVSTSTKNLRFTAGIFGENLEANANEEGYAIASRLVFNPDMAGDTKLHLGGSFRYRDQGDSASPTGSIRYRQRPVSHVTSRILNTNRIAESDVFFGLEGAAIMDSFWVAGEYGMLKAECPTGSPCASDDPNLNGVYAEIGKFFGGKKGYKGGKFNRPKVDNPITEGGRGALSLVARYDRIDLSLNTANLDSGVYDSFVLGADWWPTKYSRLGVNAFFVDAEYDDGRPDEQVRGVTLRMQFDF